MRLKAICPAFKPLVFTLMVYDPTDALNRTGLEDPFSAGVNVRGSVDLSSNPLGLPRTDSFMAAISSEEGTDFTTIPDLGKFADTPSFRNALIQSLIINTMFGGNAQNTLPPQLIPPTTEKRGRFWLGYSFEQTLWQSPADPNKAWGLFGQAAIADGNPNSYKWSAMGGIGGTGLLPGRPNDRFGVGAFYYRYSSELKEALAPLVTLGDEYGAELFYNFAITRWFRVTADLQVIAPGIKAQVATPPFVNPTVVLLGLSGQVIF
jgi:hypothetical protein